MGDLGDEVEREVQEGDVPYSVLKRIIESDPEWLWEFEATLGSDHSVPLPLDLYENHPLFKEDALYGFNEPSNPRKIVILDLKTGIRVASAAVAYRDRKAEHAKAFHRVLDYSRTSYCVLMSRSVAEKAGLGPSSDVLVQAFRPDKDTPKGYIVVRPKSEEGSG